jgi:hypothetical protein
MLIDCDTCSVRGRACDGCVVNLLFGEPPPLVDTGPLAGTGADEAERRALAVLADAGFEVTVLAQEDSRARLRLVSTRRRNHHAA